MVHHWRPRWGGGVALFAVRLGNWPICCHTVLLRHPAGVSLGDAPPGPVRLNLQLCTCKQKKIKITKNSSKQAARLGNDAPRSSLTKLTSFTTLVRRRRRDRSK
uniref:(northern house mosquito) hypothetical protein n=1 Tax=Culex pipiens TaxID=7175 RepID=A0A8D8L3I8_CULPI